MQIDTLLVRGENHKVFGEDALFQSHLSDQWYVAAVLDGCSSGQESHFASALFSKLLKKASRTIPLLGEIHPDMKLELLSPEMIGKFMVNQLFDDVKKAQKQLLLETNEILTTFLLLIVDKKSHEVQLITSGDGYFCCNGDEVEINQMNMPNYLAYHLNKSFDDWYTKQITKHDFKNVKFLTVATDGIGKYATLEKEIIEPEKVIHRFLSDFKFNLDFYHKQLRDDKKYFPFDDVSIIRVKF